MATGQVDEARDNYRKALELEPGNVGGWVDLIRLSLLTQDYATMMDDAEEARSYFPNQDQILFLYGFAAAREGIYRPAGSALSSHQNGYRRASLQARHTLSWAMYIISKGTTLLRSRTLKRLSRSPLMIP